MGMDGNGNSRSPLLRGPQIPNIRCKGAKGFLMLGFYNGKLTPNEPKISDFQNFPEIRLKVIVTGMLATKSCPRFWFYVSKAGAQSAGSGKGTSSIVKDLINSENPKHTLLRFSGVIFPTFNGSLNIFACLLPPARRANSPPMSPQAPHQ